MRYPDMMHKRLQEIRALGVKMSIDDFGTELRVAPPT